MSPIFVLLVLLLVAAQLALPKQWAFLPLIIIGCHFGNVEILPELTPARLIIIVGLLRALASGGGFILFRCGLDRLMLVFSCAAILSTLGHEPDPWTPSPFNARAGLALNILGSYFYGRAYLPDAAAFKRYVLLLPLVLLPLAVFMTMEHQTRQNPYFAFGAARAEAMTREEKVRAQGPFRHPILAGTAGATILPLVFLLWQLKLRKRALLGLGVCLTIVLSCASSGPLAAVAVSLASVLFWHKRSWLKPALWSLVGSALFFSAVSGRGPWYLMARIDLVGGSTGWHRAYLIDQAFNHLNEWWLIGADYTRHWMPTGVSWSPNHVDMTNYYLHLGVIGGLPLMLCFVGILVSGFRQISRCTLELRNARNPDEIILWCAGASLATHAISFISISYVDQMYIFLFILLGAIPGLVTSNPLSPKLIAPTMQTAEPVETKPLRFYS